MKKGIIGIMTCIVLTILIGRGWGKNVPYLLNELCAITHFSLSGDYLVAWGDEVIAHAETSCSNATLLLSLNDEIIDEFVGSEAYFYVQTSRYPFGRLVICIEVASEPVSTTPIHSPQKQCWTIYAVDPNALNGAVVIR